MRIYNVLLVAVAALIVLPAIASAQDEAPSFTGTYKFAGGKKQKQNIVTAIEAATDDMNFITRPIARSRLKDTNYAYRKVDIKVDGGNISIGRDGAKPITTSDGGSTNWTREDGSQFKVTQKLNGNRLVQTYSSSEGSRTNVYTLNKDGSILTIRVKVTSPKLPKPVTYAISYKRG